MTPSSSKANGASLRRVQLVGVLLVFAVGCSAMAERIIARRLTRQLDKTFDLDDSQKDATRNAIDRLIDAAPNALRAKINTFVSSLDSALADGLNEQNLLQLEGQLDAFADVVANKVFDEGAPLLATLRDAQIAHGQRELSKGFDERRKELSAPESERTKARQDEFIEAVEDWTGSLSDAQEAQLRTYVTTLPDHRSARIDASEARTERMAKVLRAHPGQDAIRTALTEEWTRRDDWGPDAEAGDVRRAQARSTLIYIDRTMTPKQRKHARDHLHKLHRRIMRFIGDDDA